jgi:geranylgeranyl diphosphate synthase type I
MGEMTFVAAVEDQLRAVVTRGVAEALETIDAELRQYAALCTSAVTAGGKRLRPRFAYWGWRAGDADPDTYAQIVTIGAALELLHAAILVHDDIIDSAPLRRGLPSVRAALADRHRARQWAGDATEFGDHAALLLGDLLWASAQDAIGDGIAELPSARRAEVTELFRAMRLEVMAGQLLELDAQAAQLLTDAAAHKIVTYKTSKYTVERPVALGLTVAEAPAGTRLALGRYAAATGRAFQLRDDLSDLYGPPSTSGKIAGGDIRDGKPTELLGTALRLATEADRRALRHVIGDPDADRSAIEGVMKICHDTGAVHTIGDRVTELTAGARSALREPGANLPEPVLDAFDGLLDECTDLSFLGSAAQ